ncbi:hypothetical protein PSI22_17230 [Xenorhabdus sp. XENO-7]|uniref:Inner membrane protein yafU n=1 Tax=Xenorhabdus aichiensis TaxID=3025874 RepID=A0ABT5M6I9_9GAMM|nr:hypothetical protein [Xenorhabdus aichiensis]MDC9623333.1 hypothetical protein [Xenorhabdus aichiensis]
MDIKKKNEFLDRHFYGIYQIDEADGKTKRWDKTSQYTRSKSEQIGEAIDQLDQNTELFVVLTIEEAINIVKNLCGPNPNSSWKDATFSCSDVATSFTGNIIDAYAFGRLANELSSNFGVRVTEYVDRYGNRSIKLTGRTGVRNFLTAAKYSANHWKMIDMGIGTQGMQNGMITVARYCVIVSVGYRFIELLFRDEYDIYNFFGNITMDVAKIAVGIFVGMAANAVAGMFIAAGTYVLAVTIGVILVGIAVAGLLYYLDNKFELSKKLIEYMRENELSVADKLDYRKQPFGYPYPNIR